MEGGNVVGGRELRGRGGVEGLVEGGRAVAGRGKPGQGQGEVLRTQGCG